MAGTWEGDGSEEIRKIGSTVECQLAPEASTGDASHNAIWKDNENGVSAGTHYWKITFLELSNSAFVGLTDREKFLRGWECRGLLYGGPGNLASGGSLLVSSYGPAIKAENTVGMLVVFESGKIKIYFDLNGVSLGLAFDLDASIMSGGFPLVKFSGPGKARIVKSDDIPTNLNRAEPVYNGIEGNWRCKELSVSNLGIDILLSIFRKSDANDGIYKVILRVINKINFNVRYIEDASTWILSGASRSTRVGGSVEALALERQISRLVTMPTSVEVEEGILTISSNQNDGLTSKWERYSTAKQPVTTNPFN